jgi:hypothetical protein
MIVETLEISDWEPLIFRLVPAEGMSLKAASIGRFVHTWFHNREKNPVCGTGCHNKFVDVKTQIDGTVMVSAEWVCPDCLNALLAGLGAKFPEIERALIGFLPEEPPDTLPEPAPARVLAFKGRTVTFEDGCTEAVADFQIVNAVVTIGDMQRFCDETGYVTWAEHCGPDAYGREPGTFKKNAEINHLEPWIHPLQAARCLSYNDAFAYCSWSGHRLITEGEYFVAAQLDDQVHPYDYPGHKGRVLALDTGKVACFANTCSILTQTRVGDQIVMRYGPTFAKHPGWEKLRHRRLVGPNDPVGQIVPVIP